ncbi:MAG: hypothetical protein MUC97_12465 [Bernardetiaceae bacterium]|jgi:hypothetical protein|nr:hypothetical protein [Bernardetiaceae bacterium]
MKALNISSSRLLIPFISLAVLLSSCFPERDLSYQGDTLVEFKNHRAGFTAVNNARINNVSNGINARTVRQTVGVDTIFVQLIGPQRAQPVEVAYEVDAQNSTAVDGTHYRFRGNRGQVVIAPNTSVGYLILDVQPNSVTTAAETRNITLVLNGNPEVAPSANFRRFTYTIRQ